MQLNYLGANDLHEPLQSAYKIFHITETALLTVTNDIMLSLDKGENVFPCLFMHMSSICRSPFHHLRNLSRIRKYLTKESAAVVV